MRFLNLVVTETKPSLRRFAQEEAVLGNRGIVSIPFKTEYAFMKLLNRELELGRALNTHLNAVKLRSDFNVLELFNVLDNFRFNFIAKEKYYFLINKVSNDF